MGVGLSWRTWLRKCALEAITCRFCCLEVTARNVGVLLVDERRVADERLLLLWLLLQQRRVDRERPCVGVFDGVLIELRMERIR